VCDLLKRLADSTAFQNFVVGTILLSAILVGLDAHPWVSDTHRAALNQLEHLILGFFGLELLIRIGTYGNKPWRFFQDAWNLFDFFIVVICLLPGTQFAAVLRLLRILRVLRLLRLVSQAREAQMLRLKNAELEIAYRALREEQEKSERLLLNILPHLVAQRLKSGEKLIADSFPDASVLFADIVGFTHFSSQISPEKLVGYLDSIFSRFDHLLEPYGVEKIKTIGDAYMVVCGIPQTRHEHLTPLVDMALEMLRSLDDFNREQGLSLQIRIGIHSGPVVAGVIGQKKFIYDLWGDTVNTASRMESCGVPGKIQITEETRQRLSASYQVMPRGKIAVKGKGEVMTYFIMQKFASGDFL